MTYATSTHPDSGNKKHFERKRTSMTYEECEKYR